MVKLRKPIIILMADDDSDDRLLAQEALTHIDLDHEVHTVADGEALMDYLHRRGSYESMKEKPLPGLILLDLNMPRMSGLDALQEIKLDPMFRRIPTVILTTSNTKEDVHMSYDMGANSYVTKSVTFESLVDVVEEIGKYWLEVVQLPPELPPSRT